MTNDAYRQSPFFHFNVDGHSLMLKVINGNEVYIREEVKQKWEESLWDAKAHKDPETGLWHCSSEWDVLREDDCPNIFEGMEGLANSIAVFLNENALPGDGPGTRPIAISSNVSTNDSH
jgi:hypothetical protein